MAKKNDVTDESGQGTGDDAEPGFIKGYETTDPRDANTDTTPGWQNYGAPGDLAIGYKAFWKTKPRLFPNGPGDDGTA